MPAIEKIAPPTNTTKRAADILPEMIDALRQMGGGLAQMPPDRIAQIESQVEETQIAVFELIKVVLGDG